MNLHIFIGKSYGNILLIIFLTFLLTVSNCALISSQFLYKCKFGSGWLEMWWFFLFVCKFYRFFYFFTMYSIVFYVCCTKSRVDDSFGCLLVISCLFWRPSLIAKCSLLHKLHINYIQIIEKYLSFNLKTVKCEQVATNISKCNMIRYDCLHFIYQSVCDFVYTISNRQCELRT